MNCEEKNWQCEAVNSNAYFRTAIPHKVGGLTSLTY